MRPALLAALALLLAGCTGQPGAVQSPPETETSTTPDPEPEGATTTTTTTTTPPPTTTSTTPPPTRTTPPPPPASGPARQMNVTVFNHAFTPRDIVVAPGSTVTWTNADARRHSVALDDDGTKRAGPFGEGEHGALTFPEPGVYAYHCELHPSMTGIVRVEALPPHEPEPAPPVQNHTVEMTGSSFSPSVLRVSLGSTITWVNRDHEWHEAESDWAGWFGSGLLNQGQSFSVTMDRKGTFGYRCDLHSMRGTLIVE